MLNRLLESPKLDPNKSHYMLSLHGPDRVGLIASLANSCATHGASISESKMVRCACAIVVVVAVVVVDDVAVAVAVCCCCCYVIWIELLRLV